MKTNKNIKPVLKKPKVKLVKGVSATKLVQELGRESGALVRQVENPYIDPVQDNRSLYFKEEFKTEARKSFGGFL